ncbi:hypothetical protein LTR37_001087 [Vermiconidia calcicola]|uniref:Uncharacterized protein n=1 Tax=Vermiconidia calcicola TaxID=1690605 RepID=A0ACC3NWW4_9PEZI|nr:hypothetical protein LTR37_001087 [Vermiconidia calcicola]
MSGSVRVIARVRPLLKGEIEKDVIVEAAGDSADCKTIVRIPNPKKESESFSFQFNSVYPQGASQQTIFDNEVAPTVKHLFKGFDVTLFAYGVTGTGKTHTMRGGKSLQERGVIPRLLSNIYRKARKLEKDGETQVEVTMSYYEIYNDRVFDLFEPPEQRTPAGLPIRDNNGKTVVVGLTERPCTTLKDFELSYEQANAHRSTSATKLNAHSSRSHAILCVKVAQTTGDETRISTASAIDLAGSEDNRRTDNNKDRLVESASINKSLFVLAQCVEAISKKQARIPYRESKMTRILSLGQNNGYTVMILNLAPVRSYHLDTLSSLNFANRTKKIEVNEIENQPFFREQAGKGKGDVTVPKSYNAPSMHRQPLRPKLLSQNSHLDEVTTNVAKPARQFSVYSDQSKPPARPSSTANTGHARASTIPIKSPKRTSSEAIPSFGRPSKFSRPNGPTNTAAPADPAMSKDAIEALIERKVTEALADRADQSNVSSGDPISDEVQKRLEALEKRVEGKETERAEGLQYLLMAKQHQVRGEEASALKMYQLALPHFPGNEKLVRKVAALQEKIATRKGGECPLQSRTTILEEREPMARRRPLGEEDESYHEAQGEGNTYEDDDDFAYRPRTKIRHPQSTDRKRPLAVSALHARKADSETLPKHPPPPEVDVSSEDVLASALPHLHPQSTNRNRPLAISALHAGDAAPESSVKHSPLPEDDESSEDELASALISQTPRTKHLLTIINTKDVSQIKLLKGVGAKRAEAIVNCLCDLEEDARVTSLKELGKLKGVGVKTVENMRSGLVA